MALQFANDVISETPMALTTTNSNGDYVQTTSYNSFGGYQSNCIQWSQPYGYWYNYPVYITTDKTKKAIDILKALQADKVIVCQSIPHFLELVDKITGLL